MAGSDRSFGLVMAAALAVVTPAERLACRPAVAVDRRARRAVSGGGLASARRSLHPLNRIWLKFGLLLHKVVNPIVMALLFYGTILPTGLVMRMLGRDLLRLSGEPRARTSYWIVRQPPGTARPRQP